MKTAIKPLRICAPQDRTGLNVVLEGCYDVPGLSFELPPNILDIGANVGAASIWFCNCYPGCTLQAYEPHPEHVFAIRENIKDYPSINISIHEVAVVGPEWSGKTMLFDGINGPGQRSIYRLGEQRSWGVMVQTMQARELPAADILKIDTEGCEVEILNEYEHLPGVKAVMTEWHRQEDYVHLLKWLPEKGFKLVRDASRGQWTGDRELIFVR